MTLYLDTSTQYRWDMRAADASGNVSAYSTNLYFVTSDPNGLPAPTLISPGSNTGPRTNPLGCRRRNLDCHFIITAIALGGKRNVKNLLVDP